jgi:hypothetical protein
MNVFAEDGQAWHFYHTGTNFRAAKAGAQTHDSQ